ncbi:MAG: acetyl/propionyl/methylcrotonyl-CoA carboxylase subunit alpha [Egibacteraceae bacterium]
MTFDTVLIANRGEIAVRIIRTVRKLGLRAVAVYSDADAEAPHVARADLAVRLGPTEAARSYLDVQRVIAAARSTGAQAVHPGYGFLSESPALARACAEAGLVFVGPSAAVIEAMGEKSRARRIAEEAGVPVIPGVDGRGLDDRDLIAAAEQIGYPVLVKAASGGGGRGLRRVHEPRELGEALAAARREARAAFGDDTLLLERYLESGRHVEVQVMADTRGAVVHLGERECSLQRRYQKLIEECPSPLVDEQQRDRMGAAAVALARHCGYVGAGTVEFLAHGQDFFFLEMNTRLQVEHPVTELVYGVDLVEQQLRVAAGEPLPREQEELRAYGHAVEARLYAEDPARGFLPTGGTVLALEWPSVLLARVDEGIVHGSVVGSAYDPLLAKIVAHADDRAGALARLETAIAGTTVLGLVHNGAFLSALLRDEAVIAGRLDTGLVERRLDDLVQTAGLNELPDDVAAAAGLIELAASVPKAGSVIDPFDLLGGWRVGEPAWTRRRLRAQQTEEREVAIRGAPHQAEVSIDGAPALAARLSLSGSHVASVEFAGLSRRYHWGREGEALWIGRDGRSWKVSEQREAERVDEEPGLLDGAIRAPMPGRVAALVAEEGERVTAGQLLLVVEAMKMEHPLTAAFDGTVELAVTAGQQVAMDQLLATVSPEASETPDTPSTGASP